MRTEKRLRPNIIVIVLDTARAMNFSCYGYDRNTSPHIDRLAEEGTLFKNAISPSPWTLPAHVSLFTGMHPSEHGMTEDRISDGRNIFAMSADQEFGNFLPEILKGAGYQTVGFSNNPWIGRNFGFDRGFENLYEIWNPSTGQSLLIKTLKKVRKSVPQKFHPALSNLKSRMSWFFPSDSGASSTLAMLKKWLQESYSADRPLFAFFNFMEPHLPYTPSPPFNRKFLDSHLKHKNIRKINQDYLRFIASRADMDADDFAILRSLYDGEIAYLDSKINEIFDLAKDLKIFDRTLWVITSDHGENIGEHRLMGHQFCLYDTLLRVPLILHHKELFSRGKREEKHVQSSNVYFTIMDILGIQTRDLDIRRCSLLSPDLNAPVVSEHEVPLITLKTLKDRYPEFSTENLEREMRCIYFDGTKYIWKSKGRKELYDLRKDPDEQNNLIQQKPELMERLNRHLEEWTSSRNIPKEEKADEPAASRESLDEDIKNRLKGLGYI